MSPAFYISTFVHNQACQTIYLFTSLVMACIQMPPPKRHTVTDKAFPEVAGARACELSDSQCSAKIQGAGIKGRPLGDQSTDWVSTA